MGRHKGSKTGQYKPKDEVLMHWVLKDPQTGCWLWQAHRDACGYGKFSMGRETLAHRASWMIFRGEIQPGMYVLHKCDNPPCVNPDHLFIGTQLDNVRDCHLKGRGGSSSGEDNPKSKLRNEDVLDIRKTHANGCVNGKARKGVVAALIEKYGVCNCTINQIVRRKIWKHIPEAAPHPFQNN